MLQKSQRKLFASLFICLLSISLLSCESSDSAQSILSNYLWRLSNSLKVDLGKTKLFIDLPRYPNRRKLLYSIPPININIIEFLKLSHCDLQRHIGQRNSALGQVMKDSQAFIYDSVFIQLAQDCLKYYQPSDPLYKTLESAVEHKQHYLPELIWNASFASEEFQELFSLSTKTLDYVTLSNNPVELINALQRLEEVLLKRIVNRTITDAEAAQDFEQALGIIGSSKYVGALRLSMKKVRYELVQADQLLRSRIHDRPLCIASMPNTQFDTVNTVFQKFYIGQVQPYIAKLYQQGERIFSTIDQLLTRQKIRSNIETFWQDLYSGPNSEWHMFKQAIEEHRSRWQSLLAQCGALPQ